MVARIPVARIPGRLVIRRPIIRRLIILHRYILQEILTPFTVSLFVFTGILFLARVLKLVDLIVNKSVPISDILLLFSYVVPAFFEIAIPMAVLVGIILAFGRLSGDSEIIVLRASGVSINQLATPVLIFSCFACLLTLGISLWLRPWTNYRLGLGMFEIAKMNASSGLTPGVFNDFGPLTIFADQVESDTGRLVNVLIADRRDPEITRNFLAKYGQIISDSTRRTLALKLYDGSIQEGSGLNYNVTYFQINNLNLPQSELAEEATGREGKKSNEMYFSELRTALANIDNLPRPLSKEDNLQAARYRVEMQRRFILPTACLCICLAALALGIQANRTGKSWGASANVIIALILILVYYLLLALVQALAAHDIVSTSLIMWLPNLSFLLLGMYLYKQVGTERWLAVSQAIADLFSRLAKRLEKVANLSKEEYKHAAN